MNRIVLARSATLRQSFPFVPTVTPAVAVIRSDGSAVTVGTVAATAEPSVFEYTIPASSLPELDELTETWTATTSGQAQTFTDTIEVAGGVLFTIEEARQVEPLNKTSEYTPERIRETRTTVESMLEEACGVAFVPRYGRAIVSGNGRRQIMLPPRTTKVRSVKLDGSAVGDISGIRVTPAGVADNPAGWSVGIANYEVTFEHGYAHGPERPWARQAALAWAKALLVRGPVDDRTTTMTTEDGTYILATPGMRGSVSGIPAVDAFIQRHDMRVAVA